MTANWRVPGVRHSGEVLGERFGVSVNGSVEEVAFELFVGGAVDADAGVPLGFAAAFGCDRASAVGNRIALEADRVAAAVANLIAT